MEPHKVVICLLGIMTNLGWDFGALAYSRRSLWEVEMYFLVYIVMYLEMPVLF